MNIFDILVINICICGSVVYDVLVIQWITEETDRNKNEICKWRLLLNFGEYFGLFGGPITKKHIKNLYTKFFFC